MCSIVSCCHEHGDGRKRTASQSEMAIGKIYSHTTKAGNHGDVLKHVLFLLILQETLETNEEGIRLVDTHAGNGAYDILEVREDDKEMQYYAKGATQGVMKILNKRQDDDLPIPIKAYVDLVERHNNSKRIISYPGSPCISQMVLRPHDEHILFELNPSVVEDLQTLFDGNPHAAKFFCDDGVKGACNHVQPEKHGIYLIDPPYIHPDEGEQVLKAVQQIFNMNRTVTIVIWLPHFREDKGPFTMLYHNLLTYAVSNSIAYLSTSIWVDKMGMMQGSCVFVVNPPSDLKDKLDQSATLPWLVSCLEQEPGFGKYQINTSSRC